jgi:hypothetical protein
LHPFLVVAFAAGDVKAGGERGDISSTLEAESVADVDKRGKLVASGEDILGGRERKCVVVAPSPMHSLLDDVAKGGKLVATGKLVLGGIERRRVEGQAAPFKLHSLLDGLETLHSSSSFVDVKDSHGIFVKLMLRETRSISSDHAWLALLPRVHEVAVVNVPVSGIFDDAMIGKEVAGLIV